MAYGERSAQAAPEPKRPHNLSMERRSRLNISGVTEVQSFDEREILMDTTDGSLTIAGEGLSIGKLNVETGEVQVQGRVSALSYTQTEPRQNLWARLFR